MSDAVRAHGIGKRLAGLTLDPKAQEGGQTLNQVTLKVWSWSRLTTFAPKVVVGEEILYLISLIFQNDWPSKPRTTVDPKKKRSKKPGRRVSPGNQSPVTKHAKPLHEIRQNTKHHKFKGSLPTPSSINQDISG